MIAAIQCLLDNIQLSGLYTVPELDRIVETAPPNALKDAMEMTGFLVASGHLTKYQAEKLLRGVVRGLVFGPFRLLELLGSGTTGSVYRVHDCRNGSIRALKVLPPQKALAHPWILDRFRREMVLAQRLDHSHVARCHEIGQQEGTYYLVLDYLQGVNLESWIEASGPLAPIRAAAVFAGLADALAHAHARGLIHRDVAPKNILIGPTGHAWLVDFGMGLLTSEALPPEQANGVDDILGTPGYIAPEQLHNYDAITDRADIYGLGCCLYLALTGQPFFPGQDSEARLQSQRKGLSADLDALRERVPHVLAELLRRMLAPDQAHRPAAEELRNLLQGANFLPVPG